jgi:hypothetical protein
MFHSSNFTGLSLHVFTIEDGKVEEGTLVNLWGKSMEDYAIVVGSGQQRGVVPVQRPPLVPCPERGRKLWAPSNKAAICKSCGIKFERDTKGYFEHFDDLGFAPGRIKYAKIKGENSFTLISKEEATTNMFALIVFRVHIERGGSNGYAGKVNGWKCTSCFALSEDIETPTECPDCNTKGSPITTFASFPGRVLVEGRTTDQWGGGGGSQLITVVPKNEEFRIIYFGNKKKTTEIYRWNGKEVEKIIL